MCEMCIFRSLCASSKYHLVFCSPFIHFIISNDSVSGQWSPWLDSADAQADLGLYGPYMPKDKLSQRPWPHSADTPLSDCPDVQADLGLRSPHVFAMCGPIGLMFTDGKFLQFYHFLPCCCEYLHLWKLFHVLISTHYHHKMIAALEFHCSHRFFFFYLTNGTGNFTIKVINLQDIRYILYP